MAKSEIGDKNVRALESLIKVTVESEGARTTTALSEWYELSPIQPKGGAWYFTGECPSCHRRSPLFNDYSDGHLGNPFQGCGLRSSCLHCEVHFACPSEQLQSMQWPLKPGEEPAVSEYSKRVPRLHKNDTESRPLAGPLYHYTSLEALLSIVETKTLWATNIHYLNDASEVHICVSHMKAIATAATKIATDVDAYFLTYFLEWLERRDLFNTSVYVLCFSERHDQLSQWRGYTQYDHGVCISIDYAPLLDRMQAQGWTFQNCRYGRNSQLAWADAILARIRREAAMTSGSGMHDLVAHFDVVLGRSISALLGVAATIKNDAFLEEMEVRFISPAIPDRDSRVEYRSGRSTQIPFVRYKLAETAAALNFREITVGPGPSQQLTQATIERMKEEHLLNPGCIVSGSRIPYREL